MRDLYLLLTFIFISSFVQAQTNANFTLDERSGCIPHTVNFTDASSGNIVSWDWNFGNGETSTLQHPSVIYMTTGSYSVTLTVTDDLGGNDMFVSSNILVRELEADFVLAPESGCATPHTVFFTDQSTLPDTWFWEFGDGNTSTLQNPVHSYTSTGDFTVRLTVTDTVAGCISMHEDMVTVSVVDADFTSENSIGEGGGEFGCGPLTVNFEDLSTGDIENYSWLISDGQNSTASNPSFTFQNSGIYSVTLTVSDANGCSDMLAQSNYVQVIGPDVNFSSDNLSGVGELEVNFTDLTTFSAPIISWTWDFGDGNSANIQNPNYTYTSPGLFDVSLTITDLDGCSRTFTRPSYIEVGAIPVPTLGTWGLIILGLSVLIMGIVTLKSRTFILQIE